MTTPGSRALEGREALLKEMAERLFTQDNRATSWPVYVVEQRNRLYGIDPTYGGPVVWIDGCNDCVEADEDETKELEAGYQRSLKEPDGWTRTSYVDVWEFVAAFFTDATAAEFIASNYYNLKHPRVFVYSAWRNKEWQAVVGHIRSLAALPPSASPPSGAEHHDLEERILVQGADCRYVLSGDPDSTVPDVDAAFKAIEDVKLLAQKLRAQLGDELHVASSPSAERWQPIETYDPSVGGSVLVAEGESVSEAYFHADRNEWWEVNNYHTDAWGGPLYPTHWMPLPLPPASSQETP